MLRNTKVTALTASELLKENQQGVPPQVIINRGFVYLNEGDKDKVWGYYSC